MVDTAFFVKEFAAIVGNLPSTSGFVDAENPLLIFERITISGLCFECWATQSSESRGRGEVVTFRVFDVVALAAFDNGVFSVISLNRDNFEDGIVDVKDRVVVLSLLNGVSTLMILVLLAPMNLFPTFEVV